LFTPHFYPSQSKEKWMDEKVGGGESAEDAGGEK